MYGTVNLRKLVCAVKQDQEAWYRHDPSVVTWLLKELGSAHDYMREQARNGNPLFQPAVFESIGNLALIRDYKALAFHRDTWLTKLARDRHDDYLDPVDNKKKPRIRPVDILAFAIMVQSVLVDRALKHDMQIMAQRKNCSIGDPYQYTFHALVPDPSAQQAFNSYVACKWPIHVFSLDPMVDQQNQLDLFSQRTELQLALAAAIASGQVSFQNATTYARRLEQDLAAINLNRTAVGFGAGETTFGWQFRPRTQTPPTVNNLQRIAGILINNGPGPDFGLKNLQIEPGPRECYALMVVPNFVPMIKLTTVANWFDLKTRHPEQVLEATDMIRLSRKYQTASNAMQRLCDSGRYRPVDLELLGDRLSQLESLLPMQSHQVQLPYEADMSGSEIFTSTNTTLAPHLLTWYGEAARPGGSIFILGRGFNVRDMKVIVGGVTVKDAATAAAPAPGATPSSSFDLISRNVLRVDIPQTAVPVRTPVIYRDPSVHCYSLGKECMTCAGTATGTASPAAGGTVSAQRLQARMQADPARATPRKLIPMPLIASASSDGCSTSTWQRPTASPITCWSRYPRSRLPIRQQRRPSPRRSQRLPRATQLTTRRRHRPSSKRLRRALSCPRGPSCRWEEACRPVARSSLPVPPRSKTILQGSCRARCQTRSTRNLKPRGHPVRAARSISGQWIR